KKSEDFGEWYLEVIEKAEVMDMRYGIKGFQVFMPLGALALRQIIRMFEEELEKTGHKPVIFPTVIPESSLKREAEHIKGFSTEVFWITNAGKNKLEEKYCLRPTSETAFYPLYSIWIRSHVQLPLKLYQVGSMFRYETKMTKPLIRTREFIFIETHTAQKTFENAENQVKEDKMIFEKILNNLGIKVLVLRRPQWDKFPGAEDTYAFETVMSDGKIMQVGTTHNLGEKFAKVFNIKYLDKDKKKKYVNQTCFGPGISRILGTVIALHGDNKGIIFPPIVAPIEIVIVPIYTKNTKTKVLEKCGEILGKLEEKGFRVHLDDREQYTPGFKFHEWELKGVPLRIEIGPKDIENNKITVVRRDFLERVTIDEDKLEEFILETLDSIAFQLEKRANELMLIQDAKNYKDLKEKLKNGGFIRIPFCMREKCAEKLKNETGAEIRGTLFGKTEKAEGNCAICGEKTKEMAYVAKTY
nr:proline--tRNA ligase [Nanoarchaeum sp.]